MTLPAPDPDLRVSVVVPAKNEEERVGACLDALARQAGVAPSRYEVLLVLDGCGDSTAQVAGKRLRMHPGFRLHLLEGPDSGVGFARKLGMDTAYSRLVSVGRPGGLIASTDADSVVARNWVSEQVLLAERGAEAIGGRILLEGEGAALPSHVLDWYVDQGRERYAKVLSNPDGARQEHWQFSGASMAVTADVYRGIGGLGPVGCLEDERLERELEAAGVRILRSSAVRVTTSARTTGRAHMGLARDLANATLEKPRTQRIHNSVGDT